MASMSMADLLAKQNTKTLSVTRGQEIEGNVIAITASDIILDLGTKAEGVLSKKDLTPDKLQDLKEGDKLSAIVLQPENESGQVVLTSQKSQMGGQGAGTRWHRFETALKEKSVLKGKGLELNKGGLIVEIGGTRGFLPSSQVTLSQAANIEELVGKDLEVVVLEIDPSQNRLILSQRSQMSGDAKEKLTTLKEGEEVEGEVAAVLPFGVFVTLPNGLEGLVHISELSWAKVEDPGTVFKVGDKVKAKVVSKDSDTGRVNLSVKQLSADPFTKAAEKFQPDDVVKGTVSKVTSMGIFVTLEGGVEGLIPSAKTEADTQYEAGQSVTCLIDSIDNQKRRVNLAPFITSTKDLIYK